MTDLLEIQSLLQSYREWLKDRTSLKKVHADWVEVTTPFVDRHNDMIQIYVRSEDGGYRLTDDGHTIRDLELSGCFIDTPRRKSFLQAAVKGFAVVEDEGILSVRATADNFSARKHAIVQSILAVNDLFYTASATVRSLFKEDVEQWLRLADIRFLQNVQFTGKSGYGHHFDFAIPPSKAAPERILKAINNPNKDTTESLIFSWLDTRDARPPNSIAIAVMNDGERAVTGAVADALRQYEIEPVLWSRREESLSRLAA